MARFNEILVGRYNRYFQKLFSIKGGPPAPQLASEVAINLPLFSGVENRNLEGWQRYAVAPGVVAGGAGTRSSIRLDNPKGSNIVGVIEKLVIVPAAVDTPFITYSILSSGNQANTGGTVNTGIDNRGNPTPNLQLSSQAIVQSVLGVTIFSINTAAGSNAEVILFEEQELTLLPNSSYTLYSNVLNQAISAVIWWRERFLEDSERT